MKRPNLGLGVGRSDLTVPEKAILDESGATDVTLIAEGGCESLVRGHFILYELPFIGKICAAFTSPDLKIQAYGTASPLPATTSDVAVRKTMDKLERLKVLHLDEKGEAREFAFNAE